MGSRPSLTSKNSTALRPTRQNFGRIQVLIWSLGLCAHLLPGAARVRVREGLPIVEGVYVNGHGPYRFLIDTGTTANLIEANLAKSIGLTPTYRTELASGTGVTIVPAVEGIRVQLDSVLAEKQKFLFVRLEAIQDRWPDVQGVLGQGFLSGFDYVLDLRVGQLEFKKQNRNGTRAPFKMVDGRQVVATSLGELVLDSGAARLVLFGVQPDTNSGFNGELLTVTGSRQTGIVSGKPLVIEGRTLWRGNALAVPVASEPEVGGLLPLSLFKTIYFCNSEGYVIFE